MLGSRKSVKATKAIKYELGVDCIKYGSRARAHLIGAHHETVLDQIPV